MKSLKIGLLGLDYISGNLGCQALGYSFLKLLGKAIEQAHVKAEITCFSQIDKQKIKKYKDYFSLEIKERQLYGNRTAKQRKEQIKLFKTFDLIFDFTAGDSFSDIYGMKRFISNTLEKENVIRAGVPLILGNQTYGPFKNVFASIWAGHIIKKSKVAFTRDHISALLVKNRYHTLPFETIDVAFALPYYKTSKENQDKIKIGFNPSGLLWNGGYTGKNQFGLSVDYVEYCKKLLELLSANSRNEIHLIGHVLSKNFQSKDNDLHAISALKELYPNVIVAPMFDNPIDAKSYIAGMDAFVGARMHATIGAYSSGVPTIPFAYSRKFDGVFSDLDYEYVVDGMNLTTDEAIEKTLQFINNNDTLKKSIAAKNEYISSELELYVSKLRDLITEVSGSKCNEKI